MQFTTVFWFLSLVLSAAALSTPLMARDMHHRRHAVVARMEETGAPLPVVTSVVPRKRSNAKRCKANSSSALQSSSAATQPTAAPVNVGGDVPVFSSSETHSSAAPPPPPPPPPPAPSKSAAPAPPPPPPPKSSSTPPPAAPTTGGSLLTATHSGDATFYGTGLGSCGITNTDSDFIAAVSHILYDEFPGYTGGNPNNNPICGRKATATYQGKTVSVTITDRCTACAEFDLDFSPSAFQELADQSLGRLHGMTWHFD